MLERMVFSIALVVVGVLVYRLLLFSQHHAAVRATAHSNPLRRPELLVFSSPTCAPCKLQQIPIVDRLVVDWADRVAVRVIDVTEEPHLAARYSIFSLPTTIVVDSSGRVEAINQGVASEQKLRKQVERTMIAQDIDGKIVRLTS